MRAVICSEVARGWGDELQVVRLVRSRCEGSAGKVKVGSGGAHRQRVVADGGGGCTGAGVKRRRWIAESDGECAAGDRSILGGGAAVVKRLVHEDFQRGGAGWNEEGSATEGGSRARAGEGAARSGGRWLDGQEGGG